MGRFRRRAELPIRCPPREIGEINFLLLKKRPQPKHLFTLLENCFDFVSDSLLLMYFFVRNRLGKFIGIFSNFFFTAEKHHNELAAGISTLQHRNSAIKLHLLINSPANAFNTVLVEFDHRRLRNQVLLDPVISL